MTLHHISPPPPDVSSPKGVPAALDRLGRARDSAAVRLRPLGAGSSVTRAAGIIRRVPMADDAVSIAQLEAEVRRLREREETLIAEAARRDRSLAETRERQAA